MVPFVFSFFRRISNDTSTSTKFRVYRFRCLPTQVRTHPSRLRVEHHTNHFSLTGGTSSFPKCRTSGVNSSGSCVPLHKAFLQVSLIHSSQGTILLTANVAFLAIPSIDTSATNSTPGQYVRNPAQITSYMSILFSMGCMTIAQLLLRHHVVRPQDSAAEIVSSPFFDHCGGPQKRLTVFPGQILAQLH